MRIAMFSTDFPLLPPFFQSRPLQSWWGGVSKVTYKLAIGMAERGHEVDVFATHSLSRRQDIRWRTVSLHLYPADFRLSQTYVSLAYLWSLPQTRPDIVHAHGGSPPGLIAGWACSRRTRAPLVTTLHADLFLGNRGPASALILQSFARFEQRILRDSRSIIALTNHAKRSSATLSAWRSKVTVIPNGVDTSMRPSAAARSLARKELGIPPNAKVCLYIGTLNYRKGIDVLLEAAALVSMAKPVIFVIVGQNAIRGSQAEWKVTGLHVQGRVRLEGFVEDDRIQLYFRAADILVIPSRLEGFPLTILEGFATALPIVASNIAPHREIIRDGQNGILFEAGVAEDLARKIEAALNDAVLMKELSDNSFESGKRFTWDRVFDETESIYDSALNR